MHLAASRQMRRQLGGKPTRGRFFDKLRDGKNAVPIVFFKPSASHVDNLPPHRIF
ncbi:MAG: hypothetical protein NC203_03875 [Firmicutes bacterium]|nr:hypothetical protein [Bacillota bacterium]